MVRRTLCEQARPRRYRPVLTGLILSLSVAGPAHAASQGSLGATSTGTVTITASVSPRANISGLTDIAFIDQVPTEAASGTRGVCIWSNTRSQTYTVTASGSGPGGDFLLSNGARKVPYAIRWNAPGAATSLSNGVTSMTLISAANQQTCKSEPRSASLTVEIEPSDLQTMEPGVTYVGTLTLIVAPE